MLKIKTLHNIINVMYVILVGASIVFIYELWTSTKHKMMVIHGIYILIALFFTVMILIFTEGVINL